MKPPFAYYGGKSRHVSRILAALPPHRVYVEPFAGSAAVLFAKPPAKQEVLNDVDGQVINFYRVLRDRLDELERAVLLTPYARADFDAADFDAADIDDVERARRWYCRSTQGFGQSAGDGTGWSISTKQNTPRTRQIARRVGRFDACAERLSNVFIENRDALGLIARFGTDPGACLYLDPPYLIDTRSAPNCYRHEFQAEDQHRRLAAAVSSCAASVVLSGYRSALYDDLYRGWDRTEWHVTREPGNGRTRRVECAVEVLWSNRPLRDVGRLDFGTAS